MVLYLCVKLYGVILIKWILYYSRCSFSGLEPYVSCNWWVTALIMRRGLLSIGHFVHSSGIYNLETMATWSPPGCMVVHKSKLLYRTRHECDVFLDVSGSGCGIIQNAYFSVWILCTQLHSLTPHFEYIWVMTSELRPQTNIANSVRYAILWIFQI